MHFLTLRPLPRAAFVKSSFITTNKMLNQAALPVKVKRRRKRRGQLAHSTLGDLMSWSWDRSSSTTMRRTCTTRLESSTISSCTKVKRSRSRCTKLQSSIERMKGVKVQDLAVRATIVKAKIRTSRSSKLWHSSVWRERNNKQRKEESHLEQVKDRIWMRSTRHSMEKMWNRQIHQSSISLSTARNEFE